MFNIPKYATRHSSIVWLLVAIIAVGGIYSFTTLGKREDSTFTIKSAVVICSYPGATPEMVESLVLEPLEREIRTLRYVDEISSEARYGRGELMVKLLSSTPAEETPQIWDELRSRVTDARHLLPSDIGGVTVEDDFGDVLGIYYALVADEGFEWRELRDVAERVVRELYTIAGVEKIVLAGEPQEQVTITITPATLAMFDLTAEDIREAIAAQSSTLSLGEVESGAMEIIIAEGSPYSSITDIENQLLTAADGKQYRLGDIMHVERTLQEPRRLVMRVDGQRAVGIAISTDPLRDVVAIGEVIDDKLEEIRESLPVGLELRAIYPENEIARRATNDFLINLAESLAIVILLIIITMGWRSGVTVGCSLLLAVAATMLIMLPLDETLNRTSLAGFIIAMGMLVDNAIVVTDNSSMLLLRGIPRHIAVVEGARRPQWGLLGATLIAIASFLPLQLAPSSVAEIIRPLFVVIAVSLLSSWVLAITQVPEMNARLLTAHKTMSGDCDRSAWFRPIVEMLIRYRWVVVAVAVLLFGLSIATMAKMPQNFFPQLAKPMFRADIILPEGYSIEATDARLNTLTTWLLEQEEVKQVSTTAGGTPPRYYLASGSYSGRSNYGNIVVELQRQDDAERVEQRFEEWVESEMADVWLRSSLFKLSPVPDAEIEFGFVGEDIATLARLVEESMAIMRNTMNATNIRCSWGNRIPTLRPEYSQLKGQRIGVDQKRWREALEMVTDGMSVGAMRDGSKELEIVLRTDILDESGLQSIGTIPVFSRRGTAYAIEQASSGFEFDYSLATIRRIDSKRVMKAQCDTRSGANTIALLEELRRRIESEVDLPEGYELKLFGEEESREESNRALGSKLPLTGVIIVVILVLLFGNYRDPLVVLLTMPLIFIGVVMGLGIGGRMFDFFSLLGLLGLVGMHTKSGVILLERISELRRDGMGVDEAAARAATDRLSPVVTAAGTTVLGLIPLVCDEMFGSMALTIMGGLVVGTLLIVALLPVVYSILYMRDA
ncbi:MAG: efflux RND transporter permease subunit [Alistipes sp.]|nr:efflux RND transporter permease subunit [Alistipes sp.]